MNLKRIIDIYDIIKERLPSTYPKPKLAFFEDEECMLINNKLTKKADESVYAVVNPETYTINLPLSMTFKYVNAKGEEYQRDMQLNKMSEDIFVQTILHEIGHLYLGEKYGYDSVKYHDEDECDVFADRWLNRLKRENLI